GLVHSAPGHGPEDFELGQKLGLPAFSPVDARGRFTDDAGAYAGQSVREANPRIVADLRAAHALFAEETIVHAYGHCWRCKTPILFRATVQWFLKVADVKPKLVEEVGRVSWFPARHRPCRPAVREVRRRDAAGARHRRRVVRQRRLELGEPWLSGPRGRISSLVAPGLDRRGTGPDSWLVQLPTRGRRRGVRPGP